MITMIIIIIIIRQIQTSRRSEAGAAKIHLGVSDSLGYRQ